MLTHLTSNQSVVLHFAVESKGLYMGDTVSVIGVLYPLPYEGVANDAVLLPNKDFLEFNEGVLDRYFLRLDNIFKPDGVALKDECFEEYVSVNGTVGAFGGLPFINTDLVYRLSGGQELNCLERELLSVHDIWHFFDKHRSPGGCI